MTEKTTMTADMNQEESEAQARGLIGYLRGLYGTMRSWMRRNEESKAIADAVTAIIEQPEDSPGEETEEKALLTNILNLGRLTIADCMCPRADIVAVEIGVAFNELARLFSAEGHSRLPVYRKELDEVVGMIHIKDVVAVIAEGKAAPIESLMRPVPFVPPTKPVLDMLREMRQAHQHLAIVVDEFGGVDGLVTIEDLVEQIVGEINDEHDEASAPSLAMRPDGTWLVDARMPLATFAEQVPLPLNAEEIEQIETLGGLVLSLANRVPRRGEKFTHGSGYWFEVIDADRRRLKKLAVHTPKEEESATTATAESETAPHLNRAAG